MRAVPTDAEALEALKAWPGTQEALVDRIRAGVVNDTWRVTVDDHVRALRRHRRNRRPSVELEHAAAIHARERGIPNPLPIPTNTGAYFHEQGGNYWTRYSWAPGAPPRGTLLTKARELRLTSDDARLMGHWLARIRTALADFNIEPSGEPFDEALGWVNWIPSHDTDATLAEIDRLLEVIDHLQQLTEVDLQARAGLESRRQWLDLHREFRPPPPIEPRQLVHGDYNASNIFVEQGTLAALIDWDEVHVLWPSIEVVSTASVSLDLEPILVASFLEGYWQRRDLPQPLLQQAVAYCSWDWAHGLWAQQMVYLEGDDRLRPLAGHAPFTPLHVHWPD